MNLTTLLNSESIDQETLTALNNAVCAKLEELFQVLEVEMSMVGRYYLGCCPIHGGNNPTALNLYPEGYSMSGFWRCNTRHCHTCFAQNIIGFTRGVLSRKQKAWAKTGDKSVSFKETLRYLIDFLGNELHIDYAKMDKKKFVAEVEMMSKPKQNKPKGLTRSQVRKSLLIPAKYFVDRKYPEEVLDKYDVGFCDNPDRPMYNRVVVPVYDNHGIFAGCQGRSVFEPCPKCELYHSPKVRCPTNANEIKNAAKWLNSNHFNVGSHLYNLWGAKPHIEESRSVILVEGPGDVWRLEEAGVHNAVALFGANFTDQQEILLETCGALSVIILTDNDKAGNHAAEVIRDRCDRLYTLIRPTLEKKDVGAMTVKEIKEKLCPIFQKAERRF